MKRTLKLLVCSLLLLCGFALGQQSPTNFGAVDSFTNDSIDLSSLTPSVNVPVLSKKGAIPFNYSASLTSFCGVEGQSQAQTVWCTDPSQFNNNVGLVGMSAGYTSFQNIGGGTCLQYYDFWVAESGPATPNDGGMPRGATHHFAHTYVAGNCSNYTFTAVALDDSGYTLQVTIAPNPNQAITYQVWDSAGHYTEQQSSTDSVRFLTETDTFGNAIVSSGNVITDTLNTAAITLLSGGNYQWLDASGSGQDLTITPQTSETISRSSSEFNCYANQTTGGAVPLVFGYPDGTSLSVGLEQGAGGAGTTTGRIGSVTLKTGATVFYSYGPFISCGTSNSDGSLFPSSMTRTTPDGTTTYTMAVVSGGTTTTVVRPDGNKIVYTFTGLDLSMIGDYTKAVVLTQEQVYQNTGTVTSPVYVNARTEVYCYNTNQSACASAQVSYPITQRDVYKTLWNTSGTSSVTSRQTFTYDSYGDITSISSYDFGASSWGVKTTITYGSWNGTACTPIGNHINALPCDIQMTDGLHTLSEAHDTYSASGSLLTSSVWTGSTWLPTTYTYNANGTPATGIGANSLSTVYSQAGGCNGLFTTGVSVTVAAGDVLTAGTGWNCDAGLVTSTTDANGNSASTTALDSMLRPLSGVDVFGLTSTFLYSSNAVTYTSSFSSYSTATTVTLDSSGRPVRSQTTNGSNYDTVTQKHSYTGSGHVYFNDQTSAPCSAALNNDCSLTVASLKDTLGRPFSYTDGNGKTVAVVYSLNDVQTTTGPAPSGEHAKVVQVEYNGLGEVKSVCELTTSGGTACGQAMGGSGILTTYSYSYSAGQKTTTVTRDAETKVFVTDAVGRLLSKSLPEYATGTVLAYTYDSVTGACGTVSSPGDLLSVSVNGLYTQCYTHDKMHRTTRVKTTATGSAGYCRGFYYDNSTGALGTIPSGITMSNNKGRMVEAETDTCAVPITSASIITDEWFAYNVGGEVSAMLERATKQTSYYTTSATYFANGLPLTLTVPSAVFTYGLDTNGRLNTAKQGSSLLVNGLVYGPLGVTSIGIGAGTDEDTYQYDANTGAMKQFQFFVGSSNYKGVYQYNANDSLASLAITDGFNQGNTQTCSYTRDDVSRLIGDNCGAGWAQTFSYDDYGNLTQAGSRIFNPLYNTKNQYVTIGATYDAAGNLTYDGTNNITWDGYGKMMSFAGVSFKYDAFGRAVTDSAGRDILYGPLGEVGVIVYPSTLYHTYIPLPGGGTYSLSNGGRQYLHKDALGTAAVVSNIPATGNGTIKSDTLYAPYGSAYDIHGATVALFAGMKSDLNSSLFDTINRELGNGRWLSPDPVDATWSAYAYVSDPTMQTDMSGLFFDWVSVPGSADGSVITDIIVPCWAKEGAGGNDRGPGGKPWYNLLTLSSHAEMSSLRNPFELREYNMLQYQIQQVITAGVGADPNNPQDVRDVNLALSLITITSGMGEFLFPVATFEVSTSMAVVEAEAAPIAVEAAVEPAVSPTIESLSFQGSLSGDVGAEKQLAGVVHDFAEENQWLKSGAACAGKCESTANAFSKYAAERGVWTPTVSMDLTGTGEGGPIPNLNPSLYYFDGEYTNHAVNLFNNEIVIDWTYAQYEEGAPFPLIWKLGSGD